MAIRTTATNTNQFATAQNTPRRLPLTREQYALLIDSGLIAKSCELFDGEIIEKMAQNGDHVFGVRRTVRVLNRWFGEDHVFSQSPLALSTTDEPEPDVFVSLLPDNEYPTGKPDAQNVVLLVEVSNSTLEFDLTRKALRYAIAQISDYWVLDVQNRRLLVHRAPSSEGYAPPVTLTEDDIVSPLSLPGAVITVKELLP